MSTQELKRLWQYRGFIWGSVKRDFKTRFYHSLLGRLWTILDPLSMVIIYTVIFAKVMQTKLPDTSGSWSYSIYICAGLLTWGFFAKVVLRCRDLFIDNANLITKTNVPIASYAVILLLTESINFLIIFTLFIIFLLLTGHLIVSYQMLALLPLLILQMAFALSLGILVGSLNVFYRDIGKCTEVGINYWFWLTPIIYPYTILPDIIYHLIFTFNPMANIIRAYQELFLYGVMPDWIIYLPQLMLVTFLSGLSYYMFSKMLPSLVDEL